MATKYKYIYIYIYIIQVVLKVFDLDSRIRSQPIGISLKGILSNKRHFTLTLRMTNIMI